MSEQQKQPQPQPPAPQRCRWCSSLNLIYSKDWLSAWCKNCKATQSVKELKT
jgi:hypothetical protein